MVFQKATIPSVRLNLVCEIAISISGERIQGRACLWRQYSVMSDGWVLDVLTSHKRLDGVLKCKRVDITSC